jgi:gliding motility-associated-like protein
VSLYPRLNLSINEGDEVADNKISVKENVMLRQITATVQNSSLQATYQWQPERFFNPTDQLTTELSVESMRQEELGAQMIKITGETQHCTEVDTAMVQLIPNVEPTNAFSPNGDSYKEYWHIKYAEQYDNIEVVVFNRWGVEVFRQKPYRNNEEKAWDGRTASGKELPSGTYYYVIDTHESGIQPLSGTITIIR